MIRARHILLKIKSGVETRAPVHLDVLDGVHRAAGSIDGHGQIDAVLARRADAFRCRRCFHAGPSLHQPGARAALYAPIEMSIGLDRVLSVELPDTANSRDVIMALRDLDQIEWVMAEPLATTPLQDTGHADRLARDAFVRVGAAAALEIEPGSRQVAVAVIDTGVALEHPEFSGRLRGGYDTVDLGIGRISEDVALVGDSRGRDFCARDETGHGTHVAGIIGARGLSMPQGVAGESPVIPVRALAAARAGNSGAVFGVGGLSDIDSAIKVAVELGAKVINMSFGTSRDDVDEHGPLPHQDVLDYAEAMGCIPVAAMGNSGLQEAYYPAALPNCIAVGSVDDDNNRSDFSTRGDHIALSAPGEAIHSTKMTGYGPSTGTSHAAPFVAGAAALLASRAARHGRDLGVQGARQALCQSARRNGAVNPETGWGTLDIPAALSLISTDEFTTKEHST